MRLCFPARTERPEHSTDFIGRWQTSFYTISERLAFLIVLATEIVFIWLLLRSKTKAKGAADLSQLRGSALRELDPGQAHMLPKPAVSVIEHTTRTLEPIKRQRKTE